MWREETKLKNGRYETYCACWLFKLFVRAAVGKGRKGERSLGKKPSVRHSRHDNMHNNAHTHIDGNMGCNEGEGGTDLGACTRVSGARGNLKQTKSTTYNPGPTLGHNWERRWRETAARAKVKKVRQV